MGRGSLLAWQGEDSGNGGETKWSQGTIGTGASNSTSTKKGAVSVGTVAQIPILKRRPHLLVRHQPCEWSWTWSGTENTSEMSQHRAPCCCHQAWVSTEWSVCTLELSVKMLLSVDTGNGEVFLQSAVVQLIGCIDASGCATVPVNRCPSWGALRSELA